MGGGTGESPVPTVKSGWEKINPSLIICILPRRLTLRVFFGGNRGDREYMDYRGYRVQDPCNA
jgi:hypothetical protein